MVNDKSSAQVNTRVFDMLLLIAKCENWNASAHDSVCYFRSNLISIF